MKTFYPIPMHYKFEFHLRTKDSFIIKTHLSPEEVYLLLDSLIDTKFHVDNKKIFYGRLESRSFQIFYMASIYRNGVLRPVLRRELLPTAEGTQIHVTSRPSKFLFGFSVFWLGLGTLTVLGALFASLPYESLEAAFSETSDLLLVEAFLLCAGRLIPSIFFWLDESWIKAVLMERFQNH